MNIVAVWIVISLSASASATCLGYCPTPVCSKSSHVLRESEDNELKHLFFRNQLPWLPRDMTILTCAEPENHPDDQTGDQTADSTSDQGNNEPQDPTGEASHTETAVESDDETPDHPDDQPIGRTVVLMSSDDGIVIFGEPRDDESLKSFPYVAYRVSGKPSIVDFDPASTSIYWSDSNTINRLHLETYSESVIVSNASVVSFALDMPGRKLIWQDDEEKAIMTSQLNGSQPKTVVVGIKRSTHITLDTLNRWLYWDDRRKLYRTNLDAPGVTVVPMSPIDSIACLFIDNQGHNLYWVDNISSNLKSLSLSQPGSNVKELYRLVIAKPVGIALYGGHFMALYGTYMIQYQLNTPDDEVRFEVIAWSRDGAPSQIKMKRAKGLFVRRF